VAAVQSNVHIDASSSHTNHRDVYGTWQKERVGSNCTWSFSTAAETACFCLGSSRRARLRTETDKHSSRVKCCDGCTGAWRKPWLHSGTLLYFNSVFNDDHTHGLYPHDTAADGEAGPRISVALLCAEGPPPNALEAACALLPKKLTARMSQPEAVLATPACAAPGTRTGAGQPTPTLACTGRSWARKPRAARRCVAFVWGRASA
jgi:hypothetical protein